MFGILEAFSARAGAFEQEQINSLRSLAGIAEMAYERERSAARPAATLATVRAALFPAAARGDGNRNPGGAAGKRYWVFGCALLALLAVAWIARISWGQTDAEIAASTSTGRTASAAAAPSNLQLVATVKPDAAIPGHSSARARAGVIENAADIDRASETPTLLTPSKSPGDGSARKGSPASEDTSDSAPAVQTAFSGLGGKIPKFTPETAPLPKFGGPVSRGIIPATVLERVNPIYPWHARSHGIGGEVILDATVAPNGSVRIVSVISGPATLIDAAVTAVRQWRFSPALLNGKPVEVQQRITIVFKLPEGSR